ncbi:MAG TPA: RDD family protein [Candidatus Dormibacteraeota bacterium]
MQPPESDDLVVSTPERVAFQYEIAGIGSRFLAQILDVIAITAIQIVITILAASLGGLFSSGQLAALVEIILTFILLAGYFLVSEAAMNGQTVGKRAVRLRVVGDQGQPITIGQAAIRNLVRIVDFLPLLYAIGIVTMFVNRRAKRLGDFAAGTLVVRDRERVNLYDLSSESAKGATEPTTLAPSIWSTPVPSETPSAATTLAPGVERPLDPALRRLVVAYAARRESLPTYRREALAKSAEPALRVALPEIVASAGPLAALDLLAQREGVTPFRPVHASAGRAMLWGITSLIFVWFPLISIPTSVLAIVFANRALSAIRRQPDKVQGADRARTARLLGIIALVISSLIAVLFIVGLIFRG